MLIALERHDRYEPKSTVDRTKSKHLVLRVPQGICPIAPGQPVAPTGTLEEVEPVVDLRPEPRLWVVGGAPRAGKSRIARHIWTTSGIPGFSMDTLIGTFMRLAPDAGLDWGESPARAEKIAKAARLVVAEGIETHDRFLLEGESVTPFVADTLRGTIGIRACFMVMQRPNLLDILEHEHYNVWVRTLTKADRLQAVRNIAERSAWLVEQCNRYNFPYVDMADGSYQSRVDDVLHTLDLPAVAKAS